MEHKNWSGLVCNCVLRSLRIRVPFNEAIKFYLRVPLGQRVTKHKIYSAYCPWCDEPKMRVNPMNKVMYCNECGAGGDLISVVAKSEDETPREAIQHLIEKYELVLEQCTANECRGSSSAG